MRVLQARRAAHVGAAQPSRRLLAYACWRQTLWCPPTRLADGGRPAAVVTYYMYFATFSLALRGFAILGHLLDDPRCSTPCRHQPGIRPPLGRRCGHRAGGADACHHDPAPARTTTVPADTATAELVPDDEAGGSDVLGLDLLHDPDRGGRRGEQGPAGPRRCVTTYRDHGGCRCGGVLPTSRASQTWTSDDDSPSGVSVVVRGESCRRLRPTPRAGVRTCR